MRLPALSVSTSDLFIAIGKGWEWSSVGTREWGVVSGLIVVGGFVSDEHEVVLDPQRHGRSIREVLMGTL
jgi:hypothetical protein